MQRQQVFLTVFALCMAAFVQGCIVAAVGAGAGTIAYVKGDLETVEAKDIDDVYEATKKAMKQLELRVTKDAKDAMSAVIIARDAQDKKITITLKGTAEEATKISIRVGLFGNEPKSQRIYEQIKKNLE